MRFNLNALYYTEQYENNINIVMLVPFASELSISFSFSIEILLFLSLEATEIWGPSDEWVSETTRSPTT